MTIQRGLFVGSLFLAMAMWLAGSRAEYSLEQGDKVELSVAGFPDLLYRLTIGPDGEVNFPIIGTVEAAGISVSELQSRVQKVLASKPFSRRGTNGGDVLTMLTPEQILVSVFEYRSIYLRGDIAKPGEEKFRPGMTVRQAVAIAGGYDILRYRMNNPYLEAPDLRAEYEFLWAQFASNYALSRRIDAELKGETVLDSKQLENSPVPAAALKSIVSLANDELKARDAAFQSECAFYEEAITKEEARLALLKTEHEQRGQGVKAEADEMERVRGLRDKGLVPNERVTDIRRASLSSQSQLVQVAAQFIQAERARDDLKLRLAQYKSQHRILLMRDLQAANVAVEAARTKLQAVGEKFVYVGMVKSQLTAGRGAQPTILIFRQGASGPEQISAGEDMQLAPGDVLEIALKNAGTPAPGH